MAPLLIDSVALILLLPLNSTDSALPFFIVVGVSLALFAPVQQSINAHGRPPDTRKGQCLVWRCPFSRSMYLMFRCSQRHASTCSGCLFRI